MRFVTFGKKHATLWNLYVSYIHVFYIHILLRYVMYLYFHVLLPFTSVVSSSLTCNSRGLHPILAWLSSFTFSSLGLHSICTFITFTVLYTYTWSSFLTVTHQHNFVHNFLGIVILPLYLLSLAFIFIPYISLSVSLWFISEFHRVTVFILASSSSFWCLTARRCTCVVL